MVFAELRSVHIFSFTLFIKYLLPSDRFHEIPSSLKEKEYKKFKRYLKNLVEYLRDFFKRVQPLTDFNVVDLQISIILYN